MYSIPMTVGLLIALCVRKLFSCTHTWLLIFWYTLLNVWTRTRGFRDSADRQPYGIALLRGLQDPLSSGAHGASGPGGQHRGQRRRGQGRGVVSMETSPRAGVSRARSRAAGAASRDPGNGPGCAPPALTLHLQAPDQPLRRAEPAGRVSAAAPPFWVLLPLLPLSWGRPLYSPFPGPGAPRGNQGGGMSVTLASPLASRGLPGTPSPLRRSDPESAMFCVPE